MKQNHQIDDDDKIVEDVDVAAEEGEISDSVSIEEITEDDFKKEDEIVKVVVDTVTEKAAEDKVSNNKPKPKTESTTTSNSAATRVWTMQELYSKYPMSRGYAAGLYNFAWAQAVQNKPLNEVFVIDVVDDEASKSKVASSSSSSDKVINVVDSCDEMEEGEIEEGEIDMNSETVEIAVVAMEEDVINVNAGDESKIEVEKLEEKANAIRDALRCVTAAEAEKSFYGVCSKLQCTLESLQELLKNNIPTKDHLIELSFSGIQAVNSVFRSLDFNKKEHYKEIFSRLVSVVINQDPPFFAPERIKETEAMTKEKPIIGADNSASATHNAGHKLDSTKSFQSVPNDLSLEKSNMNKSEASKPGMSSVRARWNVAPLLDLHKDHDSDDLPSPTRESPSFFPTRKSADIGEGMPRPESVTALKSLMVGEGTPKPEIVTPHKPESVTTFKSLMVGERTPKPEIVAPHKPDSVTSFKSLMVGEGMPKPEIVTALKPESSASNMIQKEGVSSATRPCVTEAIKAVSTYQQKFGQNSFFSNDQFLSPTPSEDSAKEGDEDITGEISSSNTAVNAKNINSAIPTRPTFIPDSAPPLINCAPKLNNLTVPEVVNATDAGFVSSLPNQTLKASSKSRDPRLRLASSSGGVFKDNQHPLLAVSNASKVDNVGGTLRSRTKQDEPVMEGPAHKRQKNDLTNSTFAVSGSGGWLEDAGQVGSRLMNRNHLVECKSTDPRKMVTSTNHLVDCKSNDPRKMVTSTNHLLECKNKDPRKMVTSTASIPTTVAASGIEKAPEAGTSTVTTTTSLPFLLKDIAVNPTMLLNLLKMGQGQRLLPEIQLGSSHLTPNTLHPPLSNLVIGTDTSANLPSTKSLPVGQNPAGHLQVASRGGPTDEVGKIRMKPRDPRRFLHNNTAQNSADQSKKNEASTLRSLGNKEVANTQNSEDRSNLNIGSQPVSHTDITGLFTKNLKNIADLVSSSQTTVAPPVESHSISAQLMQPYSDKADAKDVRLESDTRQSMAATKSGEGVQDPLKPKCTWGDVEHLFEGFDDKQKAAIQRERSRRLQEQNKMFAARKLCLVLDLDHTLLNSAKFGEVDQAHDEILRKKEEQDREQPHRHLFRFPYMGMWTKLRPGIWNFLEKASKIFEMHLYTMGNKLYATEMAKILDPKGELFAGRVLSRGDDGDITDGEDRAPKSKDLEGVLGMESSVVIIDDSVRVWPHNKLNLIVVERYTYFPCSRRQFGLPGPSLLEIDHDERPEDGTLASCSAVIDRIHQSFFSHRSLDEVDVRNILASEQQKILGGCRILFSRVFPVGESKPQLHPLWQTAEQFGAVCTNQIDDQVTHVVANSLGTDKVNWALSTGRFVVHPGWVEASALLYRRVKEEDFAIKQ